MDNNNKKFYDLFLDGGGSWQDMYEDAQKEITRLNEKIAALQSVTLKEQKEPEGLWGFFYNPCFHESVSAMISLHKTKEGAEKAMAFHREEKRKEWEKMWSGEDEDMREDMPFGRMESWFTDVVKIEN